MLSSEAAALASELAQPFRMHPLGAGRIKANAPHPSELLGNALEGLVTGCAWRLPRPGQHAHRRALLGREQRIQRIGLSGGQGGGELSRDVAFGHDQNSGDQPLDDARAGRDDPAPAQFVHQRRRDRDGICGGQRHRQ